jgi:hypothetical protein
VTVKSIQGWLREERNKDFNVESKKEDFDELNYVFDEMQFVQNCRKSQVSILCFKFRMYRFSNN